MKNHILVGPVHYDNVTYYRSEALAMKPNLVIGIGMGSVADWAKIISHLLDVD